MPHTVRDKTRLGPNSRPYSHKADDVRVDGSYDRRSKVIRMFSIAHPKIHLPPQHPTSKGSTIQSWRHGGKCPRAQPSATMLSTTTRNRNVPNQAAAAACSWIHGDPLLRGLDNRVARTNLSLRKEMPIKNLGTLFLNGRSG